MKTAKKIKKLQKEIDDLKKDIKCLYKQQKDTGSTTYIPNFPRSPW